MKDQIRPYPNNAYKDRFTREAEKRLADSAIAQAQQAVVAASEIVSQVADVNAASVELQKDINPDYAAKLKFEAAAEEQSESKPASDVNNDESGSNNDVEDHNDSIDGKEEK